MMLRPNSAPTNTISAENTTSKTNVFSRLACGCHVIVYFFLTCWKSRRCNVSEASRGSEASAVPVDRVLDEVGQRATTGHVRQVHQLIACLRGVPRDDLLRLHDPARRPQQSQRLCDVGVVVDGAGQ